MEKPTFEQFRLMSGHQQVEHIDITAAPSYPLWAKASLAAAKRKDRGPYGNGFHEKSWNDRRKDLNALGFDMAFNGGKASEYARAVATELDLTPKVNQGTYKGTSWNTQVLYDRLPSGTVLA